MRVGHLELLALAGFFGFRGSSKMTPFVGSVKPKLNVVDGQELNVMIPIEPVESVRSVRFLRRYDKLHSKRLWSVESRRYAYKGFRACHPLNYDGHPFNDSKLSLDAATLLFLPNL